MNIYQSLNTKSIECDVLVVGSGPGGSGAAYASASKGLDTILIDKKTRIGSPVECGEVMDPSLLSKFKINIDPTIISAKQEGTIFWINDDIKAENLSELWKSISVDRNALDKYFAYNATRMGANIVVNAELIDIEFDGDNAKSATINMNGKEITIIPKVIIAADGTYSTVANLHRTRRPNKSEIGVTASYEMTNVKLYDTNKVQMFFDEYTIGGYGYIIPKSKDSANIGLGKLGIDEHPWDSLEIFLNENKIVKPQVANAGIIEIKMGRTPITGPTLPLVKSNILYVGDAAGQNLSHVGEGALPSHVCGRVAGNVAAESIKKQNLAILNNYGEELDKTIGPILKECAKIRDSIFEIFSSNFSQYDKLFLIGLIVGEIVPVKYLDELEELCTLDISKRISRIKLILKKERLSDVIFISKHNECRG